MQLGLVALAVLVVLHIVNRHAHRRELEQLPTIAPSSWWAARLPLWESYTERELLGESAAERVRARIANEESRPRLFSRSA